ERATALTAAKSMGLAIAGVDMLQSDRGALVLEVNSSPGLEGIEKATGKDIASKVIDYVLKKVDIAQNRRQSTRSMPKNA
ncbi:MAG: 30S ribosomal protein S6--L-glutamate ligase, partial [Balneolaceae bacterium]